MDDVFVNISETRSALLESWGNKLSEKFNTILWNISHNMHELLDKLYKVPIKMGIILIAFHWKKKGSNFDLTKWVTGGTKIRPGIPSNSRIFESNWHDIDSQIDLTLRVKWLGILGQILVPPVTQLFRSKESIFLSVLHTQYWRTFYFITLRPFNWAIDLLLALIYWFSDDYHS